MNNTRYQIEPEDNVSYPLQPPTKSQPNIMNMIKGVIIGTVDKTVALHNKSQFDLNIYIIILYIKI